jgi:hypothetical protein
MVQGKILRPALSGRNVTNKGTAGKRTMHVPFLQPRKIGEEAINEATGEQTTWKNKGTSRN